MNRTSTPMVACAVAAASLMALAASSVTAQPTAPIKAVTGLPAASASSSATTVNPVPLPQPPVAKASDGLTPYLSVRIGPCPKYDKAGKLIEPCRVPAKANAAAGK